jgi:hypothetical protein
MAASNIECLPPRFEFNEVDGVSRAVVAADVDAPTLEPMSEAGIVKGLGIRAAVFVRCIRDKRRIDGI